MQIVGNIPFGRFKKVENITWNHIELETKFLVWNDVHLETSLLA